MSSKSRLLFVSSFALVAVLSCSRVWSQDEGAIRALPIEKWCAAEAARDLEAKMSLFTTDVVFLVPGQAVISGLDQVRAWHETEWGGTKYQCAGSIDEVEVFGSWGFVRGEFSGTVTDSSGMKEKHTGKFINVVRRGSGGQWKIARVIFNFD